MNKEMIKKEIFKETETVELILSKEPETQFKEIAGSFVVVFKRKPISGETTQKTTQKILELVSQNPIITRKELAIAIGISEDGIKFNLNILKKKGLLRRVGPDKGGYWETAK